MALLGMAPSLSGRLLGQGHVEPGHLPLRNYINPNMIGLPRRPPRDLDMESRIVVHDSLFTNSLINSEAIFLFDLRFKMDMLWPWNLPQKGTPSGIHMPLAWHSLLVGPRSSNPRSQEYVATVPSDNIISLRRASSSSIISSTSAAVKRTLLCAGAPG